MTTAINFVKGLVSEIENIRHTAIVSKIVDALEFITLLTLPILLPFGIVYLTKLGY